jgi:hypothetical protein
MTIIKLASAVAASALLLGGVAFADTAPAKPAPAAHSATSVECSKEADAKGLHGKARKDFRAKCKKDAAASAAPAAK